jgi:quercetin dioxygenase-like cupin family protein
MTRIFKSTEFFQPTTTTEPIRSVISESQDVTIVAWFINPGQTIPPHIHPNGQDTWTVLSGMGQYYLDELGNHQPIVAGDVIIAIAGDVHGVHNHGDEALTFISVVAPLEAGYQLVECLAE